MAISVTHRGNFRTTTDQSLGPDSAPTTATSASFSPAAGAVLVVVCAGYDNPSNVAWGPSASTTLSGVTFTRTVNNVGPGTNEGASIFTATCGATPGTGTVTITRTGGNDYQWLVCDLFEVTGAQSDFTNTGSGSGTGSTLGISLGSAPTNTSAVFGVCYGNGSTGDSVSVSGATTVSNVGTTYDRYTSIRDTDGSLATTYTWGSYGSGEAKFGAVIEIKASATLTVVTASAGYAGVSGSVYSTPPPLDSSLPGFAGVSGFVYSNPVLDSSFAVPSTPSGAAYKPTNTNYALPSTAAGSPAASNPSPTAGSSPVPATSSGGAYIATLTAASVVGAVLAAASGTAGISTGFVLGSLRYSGGSGFGFTSAVLNPAIKNIGAPAIVPTGTAYPAVVLVTGSNIKVRQTGAWVAVTVKVRVGGAWVAPTAIKVRQGGSWTTI